MNVALIASLCLFAILPSTYAFWGFGLGNGASSEVGFQSSVGLSRNPLGLLFAPVKQAANLAAGLVQGAMRAPLAIGNQVTGQLLNMIPSGSLFKPSRSNSLGLNFNAGFNGGINAGTKAPSSAKKTPRTTKKPTTTKKTSTKKPSAQPVTRQPSAKKPTNAQIKPSSTAKAPKSTTIKPASAGLKVNASVSGSVTGRR